MLETLGRRFADYRTKTALLGRIIRGHGLNPPEVLMIGDGETDFEAARHNGTRFFGRGALFASHGGPWADDLYPVLDLLAGQLLIQ